MAEAKKIEPKSEPKTSGPLAPAAESSDPAVHQLLAERQTAELNGDDAKVRELDDEIAKLGYRSK